MVSPGSSAWLERPLGKREVPGSNPGRGSNSFNIKRCRVLGRGRGRKLPYPHNKDIEEAIRRVIAKKPYLRPEEFYDEVIRELREMGFYPGLVTVKRVWRIYEEMVRKGRIPDVLGVVPGYGYIDPFEMFDVFEEEE